MEENEFYFPFLKSTLKSEAAKMPHTTTTKAQVSVNGFRIVKSRRIITVKNIAHAVYVILRDIAFAAPTLAIVL